MIIAKKKKEKLPNSKLYRPGSPHRKIKRKRKEK